MIYETLLARLFIAESEMFERSVIKASCLPYAGNCCVLLTHCPFCAAANKAVASGSSKSFWISFEGSEGTGLKACSKRKKVAYKYFE